MNIQLNERIIRDRANAQSFQRGQEYYEGGAIYDPAWQATPAGVILMGHCEGSSAPSYRLRVELDSGGVRTASCTCPYDWGGDCKHIVALLLTYLHEPEEFSQQASLADLLAGLEKEELLVLITRLVQDDPDLYDDIELIIPAVKTAPGIQIVAQPNPAEVTEKRPTLVSEATYRKQVRRILKQSGYEDDYDEWGGPPAYLEDLEKIHETALSFLQAGDAEGALIILRVLLEETLEDYDEDLDYDGDVASFIQEQGLVMAEAILSADLDEKTQRELQAAMQEALDNLSESIESSELEVVLAALKYGWEELPDEANQWDELDEEDWMVLNDLRRARINVLERQGRIDEFLSLAEGFDLPRYIHKLLELGRPDEAIAAGQHLENASDILSVAQKLRTAGKLKPAVSLAERGLDSNSGAIHELATWLAPVEESLGNQEMALRAYRVAFDSIPEIQSYRKIKRLSGLQWENIRPALMKKLDKHDRPEVLADIYLEEDEWDAAIALAEKNTWGYNLLEKVADAAILHRPDWVIRVATRQADDLIGRTQSKLYPAAAAWLGRAKKAYLHKGQAKEWQAYIDNLRATYARRPALQTAIAGL